MRVIAGQLVIGHARHPGSRYAGTVFRIRVKRPRSRRGRAWNIAQDVLSPAIVLGLIVLKLTGVITWSWLWVLAPIWLSAIVMALLLGGLAVVMMAPGRSKRKADAREAGGRRRRSRK